MSICPIHANSYNIEVLNKIEMWTITGSQMFGDFTISFTVYFRRHYQCFKHGGRSGFSHCSCSASC